MKAKTKVRKFCIECGQEMFKKEKEHMKYFINEKKFCSLECCHKYRRKERRLRGKAITNK